MVKRVATFLFCLSILVVTAFVSYTTAGGPPVCAPEPYACAPQPCAPQPCAPSSPFAFCGGILGACTSICGTCIGIPAAVMGAILSPPRPTPACAPPACPPPSCAPQMCAPPMPYTCGPPPITKCKPSYAPPACGPTSCPPAGRMPLMMPLPRAEYTPSLPPVGGMAAQLLEMPFRLVSGVLYTQFGRNAFMGGFASKAKSPTFAECW